MSESLAAMLGVKVGQTVEFLSSGRALPARIVGLRRMDAIEEQRGGLVFPCTAFAGLSVSYGAGISVRNARPDAVRRGDLRQLSQHCGDQPAGAGGGDRIGGVRCHLESARDTLLILTVGTGNP